MMCAMSSGAGAGNAVLGWPSTAGIVDIDDHQIAAHPVAGRNSAVVIAATGAAVARA